MMPWPRSTKSLSEESDTETMSEHEKESLAPSCMSMKRDTSMDNPFNFILGDSSADVSLNEKESPEPSCVSMKSDQSMGVPFSFSSGDTFADVSNKQNQWKQLDFIFMELEHNIISVMKKELKIFKILLSPDYSSCSEREEEDEDRSRIKEMFLKITLNVLKKMKQTDLADKLLTIITCPEQ